MQTTQYNEAYLLDALHKLPGNVLISCSNSPVSETVAEVTRVNEQTYINSISWLAPWTKSVFESLNFIELDASFWALRPFVYSIPTGIIQNKSIPLGLFLFKSENAEMYKMFFKMLLDAGIPLAVIRSKGYLTDEGTSIYSALHHFSCTRYSCYRHLIEKMGSATILGIITRRLLFTSTRIVYEAKLRESLLEIQQLWNTEIITKEQVQKICNIFDLVLNPNGEIQTTTLDHHNTLWKRAQYGIATCSNHIERLPRTLNDAVAGYELFPRQFSEVIQIILDWPDSFPQNQHRQEKLVIKNLRRRAKENCTKQTEICNSEKCGWSAFYSSLFGIPDFPCIHTIASKIPELVAILFPKFELLSKKLLVTQAPNDDVDLNQRIPVRGINRSESEEIVQESQSDYAFLIEMASELMIINPNKFENEVYAICCVAERWGIVRGGRNRIRYESDDEEDQAAENSRALFRVDLLTDREVIGEE
jgi:hypothetical protein